MAVDPGFPVAKAEAGAVLRQALKDQMQMLETKIAELDRWNGEDQKKFKKWFGSTDVPAKQVMQARLDKTLELNKAMSEGNFKPISGPYAKSAYAQVYPDDKQYTIQLGDPFWDAPATGQDSKAGVLTHEMSHFTDVGGTDDFEYGANECKQLAIDDPSEALYNADNFEYYTEGAP